MNYSEVKEYLVRYLKARIPVIIVNTVEKERVIRMLKEISGEASTKFSLYQMATGVSDLVTGDVLSDEKMIMGVLDYVSSEIKYQSNYNFVMADVSDISSPSTVSRYLLDLINKFEVTSSTLIIISNEPIWNNISRMGITLSLDYPNYDESETTIKKLVERYRSQINVEWDDMDYKNVAIYLHGLSEMEIKNIIMSLIVKGSVTKEDLKELKYAKRDLFTDIAGLEVVDVDDDFEVAGLEILKEWLYEKKVFMNSEKREELENRGMTSPRGILLVGVPGCGKSLCSKAAANILNVPLYRLDLATVQGQYVGQSEAQLKEALDTAEFVSPCVLWIDEIEKGLKQGNGNSTTTKMIGQFLFWLQECRKPVFVVATANSIEDLPPELVRKGRFDEIFFVDLPNRVERKEVIKLYSKKYLKIELGDSFMNKLLDITEGFASSDIESTIRAIAYKIISNPEIQLTEALIESELSKVYSLQKTNPEKIKAIRDWGNSRATKASKEDTTFETL
jgi:SpoVK/Ycf46/Vps4 family AAA+-type ATPase